MAEISTRVVPLRVTLLLALCLGSLLFHFCAENIDPAAYAAAMEWSQDGEKGFSNHDPGEDACILPGLSSPENPLDLIQITYAKPLDSPSFVFQPQLPPPIAI